MLKMQHKRMIHGSQMSKGKYTLSMTLWCQAVTQSYTILNTGCYCNKLPCQIKSLVVANSINELECKLNQIMKIKPTKLVHCVIYYINIMSYIVNRGIS